MTVSSFFLMPVVRPIQGEEHGCLRIEADSIGEAVRTLREIAAAKGSLDAVVNGDSHIEAHLAGPWAVDEVGVRNLINMWNG